MSTPPSRSEIAEQLADRLQINQHAELLRNHSSDNGISRIWDALISASCELEELRARQNGLLQPLKEACDRDWKDETPVQIVAIAANAIYWRGIGPAAQAVIEYVRRHHNSRSDKLMQMIANYDEASKKFALSTYAPEILRVIGQWQEECPCMCQACSYLRNFYDQAPGADAEVRERGQADRLAHHLLHDHLELIKADSCPLCKEEDVNGTTQSSRG